MHITEYIGNKFILAYKQVDYGDELSVKGRLYIHGKKGGIHIGNHCTIYSSEQVNPTSGFGSTHLTVGNGGVIRIGNHVGMSHTIITAYAGVEIEDNVLIGSGVKIWDTDFHDISYSMRMKHPESNGVSRPVKISEGAFVGACSIILKGVTIGKHSVIGAGSVVTHDVPNNEIWAGNPARKIRSI